MERSTEAVGPGAGLTAALRSCGVLPVVRLPRPEVAVPLARVLRDAGLSCLEITFRARGAGEAIAAIRREIPEIVVGAGTVLTLDQADEALEAGAAFVVAPGTNPSVVAHVLARGVPMIPGVATPTEIEANLSRGITTMKLFPAEVLGGVAFLRAVHGPYPGVRFIPTGGVSAANLAGYLALPNVLTCGGTWIAPTDRLEAGDLAAVASVAAEAAATVRAARAARRGAKPDAPGPATRGVGGRLMPLHVAPADERRWDLVALGEVMLRLDPGEGRIHTAREFRAWEGGGEYNVARALRRTFGLRTAIVTALADNPVGRLVEDLMLQGGVDLSQLRWVAYDGVGREVRNGLNFTERGFGLRAPVGMSDRGHTAVSQLRPGDVDWDAILRDARWFHTGGIFAALSATTPAVAHEAMEAARRHGAVVSYDLNFRPSLWRTIGGQERAREVNRELAPLVDVMLGNEEDFTAALGFEVEGQDAGFARSDTDAFGRMIERVQEAFPGLAVVATSLRGATSASRNEWGGLCAADGRLYEATRRADVEILDRVGGGDAFASGLIYGFLTGADPQRALEHAAAHGALAMTTPGDTSMATLAEVESLVRNESRRVVR